MAGYDGAGPRILGTFSSKYGTPIVVNFLRGVVSTIVMVLAFQISGGDTEKYFTAVLNVVLLFTTISYLVIFPALIKLRYSHRARAPALQGAVRDGGRLDLRLPDDVLGPVRDARGVLPRSRGRGLLNNDALPDGFSRATFELVVFIPLIVTLGIGVLFYFMGKHTREQTVARPAELPPNLQPVG